jgi:hypothetical protein
MKNSVPTQFTKDRQPSPSAKSEGWAKKRKGAELAKAIMAINMGGISESPAIKAAAAFFGISENDINVEMLMHFQQARKAIEQGDTHAYDALMRRAYGSPKETIESKSLGVVVSLPDDLSIDELKALAAEPFSTDEG